MQAHITTAHPTANLQLYEHLFSLDADEREGMKKVFAAKNQPQRRRKPKVTAVNLFIAEAYSSRIALR